MTTPPQSETSPILSTVSRSGRIESRHRGSIVVVRHGEVIFSLGQPEADVVCRSAVKPMQALPLIERGVAAQMQLDDAELALTSASHNGTDEHTAVAARILARGGLEAEHLRLGAHPPFDRRASLAIAAAGEKPTLLHNNCSGKHAGFLLLADSMGVPRAEYLDPDSASQLLIKSTVADLAELPADGLQRGLDGCGAPTFIMPLKNLALAFANLTNPGSLALVRREACQRLLHAITEQPVILAGEGRFSTALIRSAPGRIYPKNGAEGVFALGLPGTGIGVAIKIDDGAERGYQPVVVELLLRLGLFAEGRRCEAVGVPEQLEAFHRLEIRNTQKIQVGEVRSVCDLSALPVGS